MAHDVFLSYSSHNKTVADAICSALEGREIRCWVAPRDIVPGSDWAESIMNAIENSKVMVIVFSRHANQSRHVSREVERAVNAGLIVIPFRLENVPFSKPLSYFLSSCHWLDAVSPPLPARINELCEKMDKFREVWSDDGISTADVRKVEEFFTGLKKDPFGDLFLNQLRQDHTGKWCTVRKRETEGDYLQTCKFCAWSDWFEPGLTPSRCCGACGSSEDPGEARQWFQFVEKGSDEYWNGYGEKPGKKITVRCHYCGKPVSYPFRDGPPLSCPECTSGSGTSRQTDPLS